MAQAAAESKPVSPQPTSAPAARAQSTRRMLDALTIPVLAFISALIVSGFIIAFTDPNVLALLPTITTQPLQVLGAILNSIVTAYAALFEGAFGNWGAILAGFQTWITTGDATALLSALRDPDESLDAATPYIVAGLAVAVGFKGGLFNIGVEGQLFAGALASAFVGYNFTNLPWFLHLPLALVAGFAAGALWGAIPGYLKAARGVNEVINT